MQYIAEELGCWGKMIDVGKSNQTRGLMIKGNWPACSQYTDNCCCC